MQVVELSQRFRDFGINLAIQEACDMVRPQDECGGEVSHLLDIKTFNKVVPQSSVMIGRQDSLIEPPLFRRVCQHLLPQLVGQLKTIFAGHILADEAVRQDGIAVVVISIFCKLLPGRGVRPICKGKGGDRTMFTATVLSLGIDS